MQCTASSILKKKLNISANSVKRVCVVGAFLKTTMDTC